MAQISDKSIVWIHGDNLSPLNPALTENKASPAIFVFDDVLLDEWAISFKRIVFIYECLLELPVIIRRGDVVEQVVAFAQEHEARRIVTVASPSPRFSEICRKIDESMPENKAIEVLKNKPFVEYDGQIDLKRFSRYWRTVKKNVM